MYTDYLQQDFEFRVTRVQARHYLERAERTLRYLKSGGGQQQLGQAYLLLCLQKFQDLMQGGRA